MTGLYPFTYDRDDGSACSARCGIHPAQRMLMLWASGVSASW